MNPAGMFIIIGQSYMHASDHVGKIKRTHIFFDVHKQQLALG